MKQEIDEELRFHLEQRTAENIAAGMSPKEAARGAQKRFGNLQRVREECREFRRLGWLEDFLQDIRYGLRMLWKNPGFTCVAVSSLTVGIAVNIIVLSCLNAVLFRSPPGLKEPERLVYLHEMDGGIPYAEFVYLRDHNTVFSALSASAECKFGVRLESDGADISHRSGDSGPHRVAYPNLRFISANYFSIIGARFALGRGFFAEEDQTPETHPVIVLSHRFWQRHFNADPEVVGKTVNLNDLAYTVVGVASESLPREPGVFGAPEVWVPCMMNGQLDPGQFALRPHTDASRGVHFYGRLKAGATLGEAKAELEHLDSQFVKEYFNPKERRQPWARYLETGYAFFPWRPELAVLFTLIMLIVGMVLLIACANVASLLLARATARQREMSVRLALGAGRGRLIRQLLTESLIVAGLAGALGLLTGVWASNLVWPRFAVQVLPAGWDQYFYFGLDWRIIRYALILTLATGFIFGLIPSLEATKGTVSAGLKQESLFLGQRFSRSRLRSLLVIAQVAVSLTFLIGTGLMLRRVQTGISREYAFDIKPILMLDFGAPALHPREFQRVLLDKLASIPGIKAAALGQVWYGRYLEHKALLVDGQTPLRAGGVTQSKVAPNYFDTLGISFVRGRNFTEEEAKAEAPLLIVSESFARQFWHNQNPIGRRFRIGLTNVDAEVIGIVKDGVREIRSQYELQPYSGDLYSPLSVATTNTVEVWVRTAGTPSSLLPILWKEVQQLDRNTRFQVRPLKGMANQWVGPMTFIASVVGVLGALALVLASVGVYGVMAYAVTQRTQELGIRVALGAQRRAILSLMLWEGMRLVVWGMLIGLAGSAAISFTLRAAFYGLSPFDPITFASVSLFLTVAALLACYLPARRATKVDPMTALRYE
jgi:predicted permease